MDTKLLLEISIIKCKVCNVYISQTMKGKNEFRSTLAIELDKSCKECAASNDSKNDASAGFSTLLTCT